MKETEIRAIAYSGVVDLRKGYWGLKSVIGEIELGVYYLFCNRTRNLCKVLRRDNFGMEVSTRRLNSGYFQWPETVSGITEMSEEEMARIFAGKKLKKSKF